MTVHFRGAAHNTPIYNVNHNKDIIMKIWEMKIECIEGCYLEEKAAKICEIQGAYDLGELCDFILESFGFDNDHLHEFFISKNTGRNNRQVLKDEFKTMDEIFPLEKGYYLFMNFDFGDDWMFKITASHSKVEFDRALPYPRIIKRIGQNPEQYPMYEEEDD